MGVPCPCSGGGFWWRPRFPGTQQYQYCVNNKPPELNLVCTLELLLIIVLCTNLHIHPLLTRFSVLYQVDLVRLQDVLVWAIYVTVVVVKGNLWHYMVLALALSDKYRQESARNDINDLTAEPNCFLLLVYFSMVLYRLEPVTYAQIRQISQYCSTFQRAIP